MSALPTPYGGTLTELMLPANEAAALKAASRDFPSWDLTPRQLCDVELLLTGAFSPLKGFMNRRDYEPVVSSMRLDSGQLWPLPVTLDVTEAFAQTIERGSRVALRDAEGVLLAVLKVEDLWRPDLKRDAQALFGTTDRAHPGADTLINRTNPVFVGGSLQGLELPTHYDFRHLRLSPRQIREAFDRLGWRRVVAFSGNGALHRAQVELTLRASREAQANLLIHPAVGVSRPGDAEHATRIRCYEKVISRYPDSSAQLALLPLATRWAGPREALLNAIVRRNFGCTHFIVGGEHASAGQDAEQRDYYPPRAAQELAKAHEAELGIRILPCSDMVYVEDRAQYCPVDTVGKHERILAITDAEFRRRLAEGLDVPEWFSYPEVVQELRRSHPPKSRQGVTVFFTGLSGAGKSTIANALLSRLMEIGGRSATLLDGDIVRKNLSSELGFSKEHRDLNILRIGYVASEITKHGGIAICAPIAPYAATRAKVRDAITPHGGFLLVHVATPIDVCESRDRKGLYAKARAGIVKEFTGVSDPYEEPADADLVIDTRDCTALEAAQIVVNKLEAEGYLR